MQNDVYVKDVLLVIFMVLAICLSGCEDKTSVKLTTDDEVHTKAVVENIKETRFRDVAILISRKYSVDDKHVLAILSEEHKYKGPAHREAARAEGAVLTEDLNERLKEYSKKYGMSEKIVASILIDYKSMEGKDCP
jgi:hypothetical protein